MEMVDMGITRFWISGRKSRSVNICSQQSDFGLLDLFWTIVVPPRQSFTGQSSGLMISRLDLFVDSRDLHNNILGWVPQSKFDTVDMDPYL